MMKSITWPQVVLTGIMLGATFAAYKYLGEAAAAAMVSMTTVVTFVMGRPAESKDGQP